ncbi:MAG TPA: RDD family protein [Solirubrobacteraceae bacterium]|jgi:uncharacterized RDD family membrane protein YckC|nr:RDD family protein [Solirubrobacteraceae bacterium]
MSGVQSQHGTDLAQRRAISRLRGEPAPSVAAASAGHYAGLVTRTLALALDALIIDGVALLVGLGVGLGVSLLHLPHDVDVVIAAALGAAYVAWTVGYFVFFWSSTGQTPGNRVMCIRVIDMRNRGPLKPRRALVRFIGLILAALPLLAGILMMLWDDRRRCLQDRLARTVVFYTDVPA